MQRFTFILLEKHEWYDKRNMKRRIRRSGLLLSAGVLLFSAIANLALPSLTANAAIENPVTAMDTQVKRWLYYRGMRACIQGGPITYSQPLERSDVQDGHWSLSGKKGFGFYGPDMDGGNDNDGTVECTDGSIWVRGATLYGYADPVALLCELNRVIDKGEAITPNSDDCEKATEWTIDAYAGANWQVALTKALEKNGIRPRFQIQDNSNSGAMYYYIGQRSVEVFCGSGVPLADGIEDLANDDNRVSVDLVDVDTGTIQESKTYLLKGDRDENSKVDDVYYNQGGDDNNAIDKKCHELAKLTRDHSKDYSTYIIKSLNNGIAEDYKAQFTVTDEMKQALCGDPPAGDGSDLPTPRQRAYAACLANIVTRFNSAVDTCKNSAELNKPISFQDRQEEFKKCLRKALPKEYDAAVDALQAVNVEANDEGKTADGSSETTCAVDGIGWIVCPVMGFVAQVNDSAFAFLKSFLSIRPSLISSDGTQNAWTAFRDIANVAFVIAFLVIVYSQITSAGISNYGIKKMLPRIVIAAILVNLSYFICAIMVDISNILGSSIYSLLKSFDVGSTGGDPSWQTMISGPDGILAATMTGIALVLLAIAVFLAPTTLLAFAVVILILIARQAFVILLIVISPLAFVAYLLPNTESWFKKWWKALSATLMVYPIIGAVFGASTLAANILSGTAATTDDSSLLQLIALGVLAVPLFAVPALLKGSMSAAGTVGQKLASLQDRANRRAGGDLKKRAGEEWGDLRNRAATRMLGSNSRAARTASFLTGTRRRAKRDDRYKQNQTLRDAAQEGFLNQGIDLNNPANTQGLSRTAQRRIDAGAAKKTADTSNQIINNLGASSSLQNNAALHAAATTSGLDLHNAEETHKNEVEAEHMRANPGQYHELNESRGDKQNAELETKRDFETSQAGRDQSMNRQMLEGQLDIERGEQKAAFEATGVGRAQAVAKDEVEQVTKAVRADNEAQAVEQNRTVRLQATAAEASAGAVKAEEAALVEELKAGPEAAAAIINGNPELQEVSVELNQADVQSRVQTQRTGAAKRVSDVGYAKSIQDDATGLADVAGGIEGIAGVSQAKAVAQQTILESFRKGVAAESTLMSETKEQEILGDTMLGAADVLDQPDERISAMGSVIAKRQHMASHIKLWERMSELRAQAQAEYDATAEGTPEREAAAARLSKAKNLQQIVMADKSKKPFGIGDEAQGDATVGDYEKNIYTDTRDRILTHMSPETLSTMDPDDLSLIYEMAKNGKLSEDHIKKVQQAYDQWKNNPNISSRLKDKAKVLLDPFEKFVTNGDTNAFLAGPDSTKFPEVSSMTNP